MLEAEQTPESLLSVCMWVTEVFTFAVAAIMAQSRTRGSV